MLNELSHIDFADASPPSPSYADRVYGERGPVRIIRRARAVRKGQDSLADGSTLAEEAQVWIDAVTGIRDRRDPVAFAALYQHFAPRVKAFLMKAGADPTTAEECAQEVMATLWNKAHLYDPSRASVATWVFTIARNRRIDMLRRARRPEPEDLPWGPEHAPDQSEIVAFQEESARLGQALTRLPEPQRNLIEQAYYGDRTHTEIAAETGLPLGTIKSRIRLALERLRHEMK